MTIELVKGSLAKATGGSRTYKCRCSILIFTPKTPHHQSCVLMLKLFNVAASCWPFLITKFDFCLHVVHCIYGKCTMSYNSQYLFVSQRSILLNNFVLSDWYFSTFIIMFCKYIQVLSLYTTVFDDKQVECSPILGSYFNVSSVSVQVLIIL